MGIERMPINCMYCPAVLASKANAEGARYEADHSKFDTEDTTAANVIERLMAKRCMEETAVSCEATYKLVSDTYDMLARQHGCPGPSDDECQLKKAILDYKGKQ